MKSFTGKTFNTEVSQTPSSLSFQEICGGDSWVKDLERSECFSYFHQRTLQSERTSFFPISPMSQVSFLMTPLEAALRPLSPWLTLLLSIILIIVMCLHVQNFLKWLGKVYCWTFFGAVLITYVFNGPILRYSDYLYNFPSLGTFWPMGDPHQFEE